MKSFITASAFASVLLLSACDPNSKPVYGDSGLPVNCRALIAEGVEGWRAGKYTTVAALESIERNCGRHGYTWGEGL